MFSHNSFHSLNLSHRETPSTVQSTTKDRPQPSPENSGTRHHSDSQIDPVMLKYMEIVKQKRQEQPNQHQVCYVSLLKCCADIVFV